MKEGVAPSAKGGAKMPRAKLQSAPDQTIEAVEYERDEHGPVACVDCRCEVRHVHGYARNVGDEQITVLAYFRLAPGIDHGLKCRYNIEKTIKRFVGYSRSVENLDPDATPILEKIGRGQAAEFRLHVLMDTIELASGHPPSRRRSRVKYVRRRPEDDGTGTDYIPTNKVLRPYFRTAKGILLLAARIQAHADLAAWVTLKFGDQTIHWDKFFFHVDQYADLFESLALDKQRRRTSIYPRPISVVTQMAHSCYLSKEDWRVNGKYQTVKTKGGKDLAVRPVLYFSDKELATAVSKESFVLVCGIPRLGPVMVPQNTRFKEQCDISITVAHPGQVCRYSVT